MTETLLNDKFLWIGRTSNYRGEQKIPPNKYSTKAVTITCNIIKRKRMKK